MKERPILFSGPMVRAILEGRKTQTRRVAKIHGYGLDDRPVFGRSPFGEPGDRLWVRETFCGSCVRDPAYIYRATDENPSHLFQPRWRPSIHMPRWASRLTLEVTAVRRERLRDITDDAARALVEGVQNVTDDEEGDGL